MNEFAVGPFKTTYPTGESTVTRHLEPTKWCCSQYIGGEGLTPTDRRREVAVHEAGHFLLSMQVEAHVRELALMSGTSDHGCGALTIYGHNDPGARKLTLRNLGMLLAAGEQAEVRWLREQGLWTPHRAWAAEMGAMGDRAEALPEIRRVFRLDNAIDAIGEYWKYAEMAAERLNDCWQQVLDVAAALDSAGWLSGDEAAKIAGLSNPPELASA